MNHKLWVGAILGAVAVNLLGGLWGGLLRMGWGWPTPAGGLAAGHGVLMIAGFLGTLISFERFFAAQYHWKLPPAVFVLPLFSAGGALWLSLGGHLALGQLAMGVTATALTILLTFIAYKQPNLPHFCLAAGASLWLGGLWVWWGAGFVAVAVPWWAGFLVLTIAGERLELARLRQLSRPAVLTFLLPLFFLLVGLIGSWWSVAFSYQAAGVAWLGWGVWLWRYDWAWYAMRRPGLTRFMAVSLLLGYAWLLVSGVLWLWQGQFLAGLAYDANLHTLFVGFVLSMIFGHAPMILPAVTGRMVLYNPLFYLPLLALHLSLLWRVGGDFTAQMSWRQWGGLLNELAFLSYLALMAWALWRGNTGRL